MTSPFCRRVALDGESHRPVPPWLPGQVKTLLLTYGPGAGD